MKTDLIHPKREYTDIRHLVEDSGERYSDRIAYSFRKKASDKEKVEITFDKVRDDVRALTTEFLSRGYQGKHVAVIGKNSYEWYLCYLSLLSADAVCRAPRRYRFICLWPPATDVASCLPCVGSRRMRLVWGQQ